MFTATVHKQNLKETPQNSLQPSEKVFVSCTLKFLTLPDSKAKKKQYFVCEKLDFSVILTGTTKIEKFHKATHIKMAHRTPK